MGCNSTVPEIRPSHEIRGRGLQSREVLGDQRRRAGQGLNRPITRPRCPRAAGFRELDIRSAPEYSPLYETRHPLIVNTLG